MNVVPLPQRDGSVVQYVRELLARCEAGEVICVTAVEELSGGGYALRGCATGGRLRTAGALLDAALTRLSDRDIWAPSCARCVDGEPAG